MKFEISMGKRKMRRKLPWIVGMKPTLLQHQQRKLPMGKGIAEVMEGANENKHGKGSILKRFSSSLSKYKKLKKLLRK
jgi:hypothetical protein